MGREIDQEQLANEYFDEGMKAFDSHRLTEAILSMQSAKRLYNKVGNMERYVKSINWLGVIYAEMGIDDMAMNFYIEGMEVSVRHNIFHTMVLFLNNIGTQYMELHKYDKALIFFKNAENQLESVTKEQEPRVYTWYLVSYMNIIYTYNNLREFDKSEAYLKKALPYIEMEDNKQFRFSFRLGEYDLYWQLGRKQEVRDKLNEIVEGACDVSKSINYIQDVQMACRLLKDMEAYDQWERVLRNFELYSQKSERIHVNMIMAEMWLEYYKHIGNHEKYVESCINYTEISFKRRELLESERANAIDIKLELREKENARKKEQEKSQIDSLTDLGNRYKLEEDSKRIQKECVKKKTPMLVGILDVDCFKQYNDTYGHIRGDECLKAVAKVLMEVTEEVGSAYRFGGDEFIIMGKGQSFTDVEKLAQNIKEGISNLHIPNINSNVFPELTISQGFLVFIPENMSAMDEIIAKADQALYQVKKEGRNTYYVLKGTDHTN